MIKVIDSSALRSEELQKFLSTSDENFAVLTDYAAMEAYKGETFDNLLKAMEIVEKFPRQIIILKSTHIVCGLKGQFEKIKRRMVDERQTKGFRVFCAQLQAARLGNESIKKQLLSKTNDANKHMNLILSEAANLPAALDQVTRAYTQEELRIIRTGAPFTESVVDKFFKNTLLLAAILFAGHPAVSNLPTWERLHDAFIFRFALCAQLLALRWAAVGSPRNLNVEKTRNDIVDLSFSAYATYYDGLLTYDHKLAAIYEEARSLLPGKQIRTSSGSQIT